MGFLFVGVFGDIIFLITKKKKKKKKKRPQV
jgi:hypothetical protein